MIVSCKKCLKTFNIQDNLIPDEGRELQCGSCNYKWFFKKSENAISIKNEIFEPLTNDIHINSENKNIDLPKKIKENEYRPQNIEPKKKSSIKHAEKSPKIIKNGLVLVITVIALIILLDTFKYQLNNYIPELDSILNNLYESLKDLSLFFNDLIN